MPLESLKPIDNIDDRREALYLLQKLTPTERVAFLYWCCDNSATNQGVIRSGGGAYVTITNETGDPMESYLDFCSLVARHGLDGPAALAELERRISGKKKKARSDASLSVRSGGKPPSNDTGERDGIYPQFPDVSTG